MTNLCRDCEWQYNQKIGHQLQVLCRLQLSSPFLQKKEMRAMVAFTELKTYE